MYIFIYNCCQLPLGWHEAEKDFASAGISVELPDCSGEFDRRLRRMRMKAHADDWRQPLLLPLEDGLYWKALPTAQDVQPDEDGDIHH